MVENASSPQTVRFGVYEVDLQAGELRRKGRKLKLQEQPFQVLALLLERQGEVVTREALREKLWPADTFVEFDHSLNTAISKIREALGDLADNPRFVETLPRRGYRFIAPVEESGQASEPEATMPVPPLPWWRTTRRPFWSAVLLAVVIGGAAWFQFFRAPSKSALPPMRVVPLTTLPGSEFDPALSPDGNHLAFSWDGETGDNVDIYVKLIGAETTLRLTDDPAFDCCPAWSPDGRSIAFMRSSETKDEIFIVPALGGPERKLQTTSGARLFGLWRFVSGSPDGRFLAVSDQGRCVGMKLHSPG
ncbi:MAG: winged helix-turn-helix domain-containing protein [Acidobacteria bacterium]|nr:winged helix-turn-helix domain-containing protein [Acidobacteriota bacterium]